MLQGGESNGSRKVATPIGRRGEVTQAGTKGTARGPSPPAWLGGTREPETAASSAPGWVWPAGSQQSRAQSAFNSAYYSYPSVPVSGKAPSQTGLNIYQKTKLASGKELTVGAE